MKIIKPNICNINSETISVEGHDEQNNLIDLHICIKKISSIDITVNEDSIKKRTPISFGKLSGEQVIIS